MPNTNVARAFLKFRELVGDCGKDDVQIVQAQVNAQMTATANSRALNAHRIANRGIGLQQWSGGLLHSLDHPFG